MITGVWTGRINRQKAEIKIIQRGDSLTGTSYYYESASNYRRFRIRGYFDAVSNEAVWWDEELLEQKPAHSQKGSIPLLSRADFNCPGSGRMMLDGKAARRSDENSSGEVHLNKISSGLFGDEWDYVIDNYTAGGNDPNIIDSIEHLGSYAISEIPPVSASPVTRTGPAAKRPAAAPPPLPETVPAAPPPAPSLEEKFKSRRKILVTEIPVTGDSIELRFYDNAEI